MTPPPLTPEERELRHAAKAQLVADSVRIFDEANFVRLRQPSLRGGFSGAYGAYELARVRVPRGAVGVLLLIWQHLRSPVGEITDPLVELPDVDIRWSLVQQPKEITGPLRSVTDNMDPKPPEGRLPPYGEWPDLRHPWGSHERLKVLIPESTTISLWVRVWAPGAEIRRVGGRLMGYTQTSESAHAVGNLVQSF